MLLIDHGIIVFLQILVGKGCDILFGQFGHAVDGGYFVFPVCAVDEGVDKHIGTSFIAFHALQFVELEVVDVGLQHLFVKFSGTEFLDFTQQQVFHFLQCLSLLGLSA